VPTDPIGHAAVLGRPIAHSRSPLLHRAAYAALGLNWTYQAIDCGVAELPAVLAERAGWAGFSCTMPLKHAVLEVASSATELALAVGAGNTLLPLPDGGWRADNTDVAGIVGAIAEQSVRPGTVTVVGGGGTAQAAVAAVAQLGLDRCALLVRDPARTDAVHRTAEALGVRLSVALLDPSARELGAELVICTLPPGAADPLARHVWTGRQAVLDVVYDPWPTALAASAAAAGTTVLSGLTMLLHQAAAQVELMTGRPAPLAAMRAALSLA
jgi:shikimate dehydrogenase